MWEHQNAAHHYEGMHGKVTYLNISYDDMQGYGYGDMQRMQAPQPDMWEQPSAAQQSQSVPPPPPPPSPSQEEDFVGGASQGFFGEMPPRGAVRHFLLAFCEVLAFTSART